MITAFLYGYLVMAWMTMIVTIIAWTEGVLTFQNVFFYSVLWPYGLALWLAGPNE